MLWILTPIFMLFAIIKLARFKGVALYCGAVAFAIDQLGNVMGTPIMNSFLLKKNAVKLYGNPDETISHVTGVNYKAKTLTSFGYFVAHCLDTAEKNHVEKAAENNQHN